MKWEWIIHNAGTREKYYFFILKKSIFLLFISWFKLNIYKTYSNNDQNISNNDGHVSPACNSQSNHSKQTKIRPHDSRPNHNVVKFERPHDSPIHERSPLILAAHEGKWIIHYRERRWSLMNGRLFRNQTRPLAGSLLRQVYSTQTQPWPFNVSLGTTADSTHIPAAPPTALYVLSNPMAF